MTPSFLLDVRAVQTAATREYFSRSRWDSSLELEQRDRYLWFVEDATKVASAAFWEIDAFVRSVGLSRGKFTSIEVDAFNAFAAAVKAATESALEYATSLLTAHGPDDVLAPLNYWTQKCRLAYRGAFEHWEPLKLPTREDIAGWESTGDLESIDECLRELEERLAPEERDELRRRVASTR